MGLMRLRGALVGIIGLVLAAMAGRVFDAFEPVLLLAVAVPAIAVLAVLGRQWAVQAITAVVAVVVAVTAVVVVAGGSIADVVDAWTSGLRRLLSTEWPSPDRPDLLGAVASVLAVGTALGVVLAGVRRLHLTVLVPPILLFVAVAAASAPAGPATWWLVVLAPLGAAVAALRAEHDVGETMRILAGDRQLVPLTLVAAGLAAAVAVPVTLDGRADPRRDVTASATEPVIDPIEAVVALRDLEPPRSVFEIEAVDGEPLPARWRTAVLDGYDGQRWSPDAVLGPIGRRLGPDRPQDLDLRITVRADDTVEVPLPGPPITIDTPVTTDAARTIVRLVEPADAGATIGLRAATDPTRSDIGSSPPATRPVDEVAGTFTSIANSMAGEGTISDRLTAIEAALTTDFVLDPSAPGGGLQQALLERFLTETHRGTEEQFVAAFVLLARSLGVDARIASGFDTSRDPGVAAGVLRTSEASVWAEVGFEGLGWVAFDPVPDDVTSEMPEEQAPPRPQSPAAAPPPLAQSNDTDVGAEEEETPEDAAGDDSWSTVAVWAFGTGLAVGIVALPVLLVVAVILALKHRRRRRRLRAPEAAARIRGAWAVATDSLVDAGLRIPPSSTDHEIVLSGAPLAGGAATELERLGAMSSAVTFATSEPPPSAADDAVAALEQIETSMGATRTRWQRLRWRLSLRSLRRTTRSPVGTDE